MLLCRRRIKTPFERRGESQRQDLIYQYRYTDFRGKRQTVYASTLQELRQKEKEIQKQIDDGIDYVAGQICSCARTGAETLHRSNPGDYDYDEDTSGAPDYIDL